MDISSETAATATPVLHEKRPVLFQESRSLKEFPILAELRRSQDEAENLEEATEVLPFLHAFLAPYVNQSCYS